MNYLELLLIFLLTYYIGNIIGFKIRISERAKEYKIKKYNIFKLPFQCWYKYTIQFFKYKKGNRRDVDLIADLLIIDFSEEVEW